MTVPATNGAPADYSPDVPDLDHPLQIAREQQGDEVALVLVGELDPHTAPTLKDEIDRLVAEGQAGVLTLDLAELTFIDSSGLRVIISAHKDAQGRGGRLVLRSPSPTARRLLDITGLLDHIEIAG